MALKKVGFGATFETRGFGALKQRNSCGDLLRLGGGLSAGRCVTGGLVVDSVTRVMIHFRDHNDEPKPCDSVEERKKKSHVRKLGGGVLTHVAV